MASTSVVTVLISTRNRASHLRTSLPSVLAALDNASHAARLVVVDNGSTDDSPQALASLAGHREDVRILADRSPPKTGALNRALARLDCRVVLFTDDDVRVPPSWVDDMVEPILDGRADAVSGGVRLAPHLDRPWLTPQLRVHLAEFHTTDDPEPGMVGANMAASLEAARAVGFDEQLGPGARGFADDVLFNLRLKAGGFRIVSSSGPPAVHWLDPGRLTYDAMVDLAVRNGTSHAYLWHHWLHTDLGAVSLRLARDRLRLLRERGRRPRDADGITEREFDLAYRVSFFRSLIRERRRAPAYAKPAPGSSTGVVSRARGSA